MSLRFQLNYFQLLTAKQASGRLGRRVDRLKTTPNVEWASKKESEQLCNRRKMVN